MNLYINILKSNKPTKILFDIDTFLLNRKLRLVAKFHKIS
jgi:hypothetical protein